MAHKHFGVPSWQARIADNVARYWTPTTEEVEAEWAEIASSAKTTGAKSVTAAIKWMRANGRTAPSYAREMLALFFAQS
jgi:hypothetical protein